ncbi:putative endo-polygalacturonase [Helianthus annuus]|nr:putative endo-polygalacturonase [Helianthus annuus]KAJ0686497.1 putative endo-polygalacturonase [Helianthus annuus]KAJ0690313.1 putative endo-polygalacturonase [Helianthus annuus]KAJ0871820.1 putative endo-polygalacturonase [Helianthus annuus]
MKMTNHFLLVITITTTVLFTETSVAAATYNVDKLGAKPDGKTDSTKAFMAAWSRACGSEKPAIMYVPKGTYMVGGMLFSGPCKNGNVTVQIDGALKAPSNYSVLAKAQSWLLLQHVQGVNIVGGVMDANGAGLWDCKSSGSKNCPDGATTLSIFNSKNVNVYGLTSVNSQMFHIVVNGCRDVRVVGVTVEAPWNSPNTDGIHVQLSTRVTILDSKISTGDDCVSIGPGATNLWIENVGCGPGHGISIGSLGKDFDEQGVKNVTVKRVNFKNTDNGFRIKSWARSSKGFVDGVLFQNAVMTNVQNPIIIDQNYCPSHKNCPKEVSGVKISHVKYQDIHGTSATEVAVKFDCSKKYPCKGIKMQDVNLSFTKQAPASAYCANAGGTCSGVMKPTSCL